MRYPLPLCSQSLARANCERLAVVLFQYLLHARNRLQLESALLAVRIPDESQHPLHEAMTTGHNY